MGEAAAAILARFALPHPVDAALIERIAAFFALRARWAQAHNLSGPKALATPEETDLPDGAALAVLAVADRPLLDVGAGSGVPAVLTALLRPELTVRAIEPSAKRAAFLRQAGVTLGLKRFEVMRAAWPVALTEPVQIVSRAVFPVPVWPAQAAAGGPLAETILRYLARERPPFGVDGYKESSALDYAGPRGAAHRLERWQRQ